MESNRLKEIIAEEIERVLEQEAARIKLTEAKLRKGDLVGVDDEIGVVNKVKGRVAYIKLPSSPGSFHPIEALRAKYKGKFKGKDLYIAEGKLTEAKLARGLKPLLVLGSKITKKVGEDVLVKLSDKFDKIDDEYAGDIASHLDMAIELMQDGYPGDATKVLKQFNKKCKEVLKGKSVGSVFEGKLTEVKIGDMVKIDKAYGGGKGKVKDKKGSFVVVNGSSYHESDVKVVNESKLNEAKEDYKYKKQVGKAFDKINDEMFNFRHAMGVKQLTNKDMKLKKKFEALQANIFALQREMRSDGLSEGKLTEANRSKVFRAAKNGSYPAVIVVIQNGKVIHQEPVSTPEVAPATFNVMQEKYPKAQLHLEDRTGKRLFSESVVNEAELEFGVEYRDSKGNPKKKGSPIIMRYKNKASADKFAKKGNQIDKVGGKYTVVRVPVEEQNVSEHEVSFSKEEMAALHNNGKIVKKDENDKEHTYVFEGKLNEIKLKDLPKLLAALDKKKNGELYNEPKITDNGKRGHYLGLTTHAGPNHKKYFTDLIKKLGFKNVEFDGKETNGSTHLYGWIIKESKLTEATDMNDPILIAVRARKTMLDKAKSAPKVKKISMNQYYKLMDKEIDLINQMKDAAKELAQLDSDMNQEAGQKGADWSDADANRYGGGLNKLQTKIEKLAKQKLNVKNSIMNYRMS